MDHDAIELIKLVLQVLLPILGALIIGMSTLVWHFGTEVIKQLREMSGHLVSIKEELKTEINQVERRVDRLEHIGRLKDAHLFHDRIGDENH